MTMTYPPVDKDFVPPEWMKLPNDVQLPSSLRMHNLIEKTALFISKHGSQMEILVKAKQANNPQFDFLSFDSPLNKYYKYLVTSMKSGEYVSSLDRPTDSGGSDDEDHYLHPSLLGSAKAQKSPEKLFLPQIPRAPDENSSYSQLVKSLKDKIVREPEKKSEDGSLSSKGKNTNNNCTSGNTSPINELNSKTDSISILPPPPHEVQLYIDKLAEYVARKGEDFERAIRKRNEARFEFLNPGNIFHGHYIKRKLYFLEEKRQIQAEDLIAKSMASSSGDGLNKNLVSFSLSSKEKKTLIVKDDTSQDHVDKTKDEGGSDIDSDLDEQICFEGITLTSKQENTTREKQLQEERRRKAALFLSLLKKKQSETKETAANSDSNTNNGSYFNSFSQINEQSVDSPNRSKSPNIIIMSPTIEAVTSPVVSPKTINLDEESSGSDSPKHSDSINESLKPSSVLPFKSTDKSRRDESPSSSPPSSTCSKHSSHHRHHHRHHHHHHHRHHHHHPPHPPHHHHHHHRRHHHHHHHHHHRRRSHSRSRSFSRSHSRSRSHSPRHKSRRRR